MRGRFHKRQQEGSGENRSALSVWMVAASIIAALVFIWCISQTKSQREPPVDTARVAAIKAQVARCAMSNFVCDGGFVKMKDSPDIFQLDRCGTSGTYCGNFKENLNDFLVKIGTASARRMNEYEYIVLHGDEASANGKAPSWKDVAIAYAEQFVTASKVAKTNQ